MNEEGLRFWAVWRFPFVLHASDDWSSPDGRDDIYAECGPCFPTYRLYSLALAIWNGWWRITAAFRTDGKET